MPHWSYTLRYSQMISWRFCVNQFQFYIAFGGGEWRKRFCFPIISLVVFMIRWGSGPSRRWSGVKGFEPATFSLKHCDVDRLTATLENRYPWSIQISACCLWTSADPRGNHIRLYDTKRVGSCCAVITMMDTLVHVFVESQRCFFFMFSYIPRQQRLRALTWAKCSSRIRISDVCALIYGLFQIHALTDGAMPLLLLILVAVLLLLPSLF